MFPLPLRLCVRISSPSSLNCRLSGLVSELPVLRSFSAGALTSPVSPKSFVRNAYKKRGVGGEREAGAMSPLPLRTLCLCVRTSSISSPNCRLLAVGCKLPLPPKTFPPTLARPVKPKSIVRNAYKKHGGAGGCPPLAPLHSPLQPSTFNLQLSTPPNPPRLTSRGTRVTPP
jgi:hypothetical protein